MNSTPRIASVARILSLSHNLCSSCCTALKGPGIAILLHTGVRIRCDSHLSVYVHGIEMSLRTMKNMLKSLGLRRKAAQFNEGEVWRKIPQEIDGPGCSSGYRIVWHTLRREGVRYQDMLCRKVVAKTPGRGRGRSLGVFFFPNFFCFNFCRYSPVTLYSNVQHLSFIYGEN